MASSNISLPASSRSNASLYSPEPSSYKQPFLPQIPLPAEGPAPPSRPASGLAQTSDRHASIDLASESDKARIVRRHLAGVRDEHRAAAEDSDFEVFQDDPAPEDDTGSSYHHVLGGDVTHDLYKYASDQKQKGLRRPRSLSFTEGPSNRRPSAASALSPDHSDDDPTLDIKNIRQPGGFRRNFLLRQQGNGAIPYDDQHPVTSSFIEFLTLYGHFGGEELEEIEEEEEYYDEEGALGGATPTERSALLRAKSTDRRPLHRSVSRRRSTVGQTGNATPTEAVLMLLKGFVGTGILFLGKAFYNGGLIFSTIILVSIAIISLFSFMLLIKTRLVIPGSFGDMGGILYGSWLRNAILFSIALSQIGFVSAYTIFVAQNLQAFILAVSHCKTYVSTDVLIFGQLIIFLPLAMIRNIQKLSGTALVADFFIVLGILYIFGNEIDILATQGIADIAYFNSKDYPLLIGTAVFTFEGIGLIIPLQESMRDPYKFPKILTYCMFGLIVLFTGAGVLGYLAFGSKVQTVVLVNLPQENKFVNAVQFMYSLAIMLSTPLQLFPAVRIMENGLFSRSGKNDSKVKWEKNIFRAVITAGCAVIASVGADDLDKFVSIVGSVACVPLCFVYPAMLHFRGCAKTKLEQAGDILLFVFGLAASLFCTIQTLRLLGEPSAPPALGNCRV